MFISLKLNLIIFNWRFTTIVTCAICCSNNGRNCLELNILYLIHRTKTIPCRTIHALYTILIVQCQEYSTQENKLSYDVQSML